MDGVNLEVLLPPAYQLICGSHTSEEDSLREASAHKWLKCLKVWKSIIGNDILFLCLLFHSGSFFGCEYEKLFHFYFSKNSDPAAIEERQETFVQMKSAFPFSVWYLQCIHFLNLIEIFNIAPSHTEESKNLTKGAAEGAPRKRKREEESGTEEGKNSFLSTVFIPPIAKGFLKEDNVARILNTNSKSSQNSPNKELILLVSNVRFTYPNNHLIYSVANILVQEFFSFFENYPTRHAAFHREVLLSCAIKFVSYCDNINYPIIENNVHIHKIVNRLNLNSPGGATNVSVNQSKGSGKGKPEDGAPNKAHTSDNNNSVDKLLRVSIPSTFYCFLMEDIILLNSGNKKDSVNRFTLPSPILLFPFHLLGKQSKVEIRVPRHIFHNSSSNHHNNGAQPNPKKMAEEGEFLICEVQSDGILMNASQSALEMNVQWLDDIENSQYHYKMSNTQLDALLPKGNPSREGDRLPTRTWTITNPHPNPSNLYGFCKVNFSVPRRILMREINAKDSNNSNTNASTTTNTGSANTNSISNSHVHCISNSILNMEEFYTHVKNEKKEDVAVFPLANIHKNETFYVLYGSNAPEIVWLKHLVGRIKESNLQDSKVQRSRGQIHIMVKLTNNMDYFGTANNNAVNSNYLCYDPFGSVLNFLYLSAKRVLSFRGVYLPPTAGDPRTGGKGKSGLLSKGGVYPSHTGGSTLHFANAADEILLLTSSAQKLVLCFLILFQNLKSALMNNLNIYSKLLTEVVSFQTDLHLLAILHESTEERHRYNPNAHYNLYVNSILSVGFSFCLCPTKHIILLIAVGFFAKLAQTEYHNIVNMNTNSQNSSNSFYFFGWSKFYKICFRENIFIPSQVNSKIWEIVESLNRELEKKCKRKLLNHSSGGKDTGRGGKMLQLSPPRKVGGKTSAMGSTIKLSPRGRTKQSAGSARSVPLTPQKGETKENPISVSSSQTQTANSQTTPTTTAPRIEIAITEDEIHLSTSEDVLRSAASNLWIKLNKMV